VKKESEALQSQEWFVYLRQGKNVGPAMIATMSY
jgi:hypothetical protein